MTVVASPVALSTTVVGFFAGATDHALCTSTSSLALSLTDLAAILTSKSFPNSWSNADIFFFLRGGSSSKIENNYRILLALFAMTQWCFFFYPTLPFYV